MSGLYDNYLNHAQILENNYLTSANTAMHLPPGTELTPKPVSYKFGGSAYTKAVAWPQSAAVKAPGYDLQYHSGRAFCFDVDMGGEFRTTNLLFRVQPQTGTEIDLTWQACIECSVDAAFPSSLNGQDDYTPDDVFWAFRPSLEYFYINMPRNRKYRYYRVKLWKPAGITTEQINLLDVFLGDNVDLDLAPSRGVTSATVDPSETFVAESGREYFLRKTPYQTLSAISFPFLKRWQMSSLKIWSDRVGITEPFWVILDPRGAWDGPVFGASFGIYRLAQMPTFQHQFLDYWATDLSLKEAI